MRINLGSGSHQVNGKYQNKRSNTTKNGENEKIEGHVEMKLEGESEFKPVCSQNIWIRARHAICRDLGYSGADLDASDKGKSETSSINNGPRVRTVYTCRLQ